MNAKHSLWGYCSTNVFGKATLPFPSLTSTSVLQMNPHSTVPAQSLTLASLNMSRTLYSWKAFLICRRIIIRSLFPTRARPCCLGSGFAQFVADAAGRSGTIPLGIHDADSLEATATKVFLSISGALSNFTSSAIQRRSLVGGGFKQQNQRKVRSLQKGSSNPLRAIGARPIGCRLF